MIKKFTLLGLLLIAVFKLNPAQASVSSIMVNADSGDVIYESNADELRYPASLTNPLLNPGRNFKASF